MVGKDLIMATLFGSGGGSSGSGGAAGVSPKEVNFYDYDGTCVHAYTVEEAQALSELPAGPEHDGLVFQGWNWSLEGVKGLTRAMNIGAMYTPDDGTTRLYITLQEGRTSPMLGVGVNGTVTVDWGDGTEPDVLTGTSTSTVKWTPNHAYAAPGDYVIRLTVDGEMAINGQTTANKYSELLRHTESADSRNVVYQNALLRLEIGNNVTFGKSALYKCLSVSSVNIPNSMADIAFGVFRGCKSLRHVTIPKNANDIGAYAFSGCYSIATIAFPENISSIGNDSFSDCYSLLNATLPSSVKDSLNNVKFSKCTSITNLDLPDGKTELSVYTLNECHALANVKIPGTVASVTIYAVYNCTGLAFIDFTDCAAVPTMANSNALSGLPSDCEIRVPAALYDEWIAATNWATFASQIKAY